MSAPARISEREVDSWIYEPIRWARKFGGDRFDPWSGQEEFWIELQNKISKEIPRMPPLKKHFMEQLDTTIKEIITILSSVPDV